ncbi:MAG: 4-fold beta flower protein [Chloroflexota bacterium]
MSDAPKLITIYTTRGDVGGFLAYPYIFSRSGEWIGWVTQDQRVFSVHGHWVGRMTGEPRILRKREFGNSEPRRTPPQVPAPIRIPERIPLPGMMAEIATNEVDVLDELPELLPPVDAGELRDDMD